MHKGLVSAALLSALTCVVHVIAGGAEVHIPMLDSSLVPEVKSVLSVVWHATTAFLTINTVALFVASYRAEFRKPLAMIVFAQNAAFAVLFVFYGLYRLQSLIIMPQWIAFVLIAGFSLTAMRSDTKKQ